MQILLSTNLRDKNYVLQILHGHPLPFQFVSEFLKICNVSKFINCGLREFQVLIDLYIFVLVPLECVFFKGKTRSFLARKVMLQDFSGNKLPINLGFRLFNDLYISHIKE